jgi:CRISPR/Cas system CSM-associated protein Csm3 (group 7 of RAMP superfamily)
MPENAAESVTRWRIAGILRTASPLHIGDGETAEIRQRECKKDFFEGAEPTYSTVMTNRHGIPVIPGTSLKGCLRSWAMFHLPHW